MLIVTWTPTTWTNDPKYRKWQISLIYLNLILIGCWARAIQINLSQQQQQHDIDIRMAGENEKRVKLFADESKRFGILLSAVQAGDESARMCALCVFTRWSDTLKISYRMKLPWQFHKRIHKQFGINFFSSSIFYLHVIRWFIQFFFLLSFLLLTFPSIFIRIQFEFKWLHNKWGNHVENCLREIAYYFQFFAHSSFNIWTANHFAPRWTAFFTVWRTRSAPTQYFRLVKKLLAELFRPHVRFPHDYSLSIVRWMCC